MPRVTQALLKKVGGVDAARETRERRWRALARQRAAVLERALAHAPPPSLPPLPRKTTTTTQRSEHNDGALSTLEEVDLHQEGLTRLGPRLRRACPRLQHLSLSGNALGRLTGGELRGLRSLRALNLALNCLRRLPPEDAMRGLESLERLDLTANFLDASALFALGAAAGGVEEAGEEEEEVEAAAGGGDGGGQGAGGTLGQLPHLAELWLMGNPCVEALRKAYAYDGNGGDDDASASANANAHAPPIDAYRACVLLALPRLARLDGESVTASERLAARRASGPLARALRRAVAAELGLQAGTEGGGEEQAAAVAALEAAVVAGEEHPETLALYGPPGALGDETSESESEGEGEGEEEEERRNGGRRHRTCRRRPRVRETGALDPATGEVRRPWCPATRLLDLRDQRRQRKAEGGRGAAAAAAAAAAGEGPAEASAAAAAGGGGGKGATPAPSAAGNIFSDPLVAARRQPRRQGFPPLPDQDPGTGETLPLRNEGRWRFSLDVVRGGGGAAAPAAAVGSASPSAAKRGPPLELELDVDVGRYLDTSHMQLEVLPRAVRLLVRGRLLQLRLPAEVRADAGAARRSRASGRLVVRLPLLMLLRGAADLDDPTLLRPRSSVWGEEEGDEEDDEARDGREEEAKRGARGTETAAVVVVAVAGGASDGDDESPPPL
jgi:protein TilB